MLLPLSGRNCGKPRYLGRCPGLFAYAPFRPFLAETNKKEGRGGANVKMVHPQCTNGTLAVYEIRGSGFRAMKVNTSLWRFCRTGGLVYETNLVNLNKSPPKKNLWNNLL